MKIKPPFKEMSKTPKHHSTDNNLVIFPTYIITNDSPYYQQWPLWVKMLITYTSRNCNGTCTFCIESNNKIKLEPYENIIFRINKAITEEEIKFIGFSDATATIQKEHILKVLNYIRDKENIGMGVSSRIALWDEDIAYAMRDTNSVVMFGFEHASPKLRQLFKKEFTDEHYQFAIDSCKKYKIKCIFNIMTGFPEETTEDRELNIKFFMSNPTVIPSTAVFCAMEGTELYKKYVNDGILRPGTMACTNINYTEVLKHVADLKQIIKERTSDGDISWLTNNVNIKDDVNAVSGVLAKQGIILS